MSGFEEAPRPQHVVDLRKGLPPYAADSDISAGLVAGLNGKWLQAQNQWLQAQSQYDEAKLAEQQTADEEARLIAEIIKERAFTFGQSILATYAFREAGVDTDTSVYEDHWFSPNRDRPGRLKQLLDALKTETPEYEKPLPIRPKIFEGWEIARKDRRYGHFNALVLANDGNMSCRLVACEGSTADSNMWRFDAAREYLDGVTEQIRASKYDDIRPFDKSVSQSLAFALHSDGTAGWRGVSSPWRISDRNVAEMRRYIEQGVEPGLRDLIAEALAKHGIALTLGEPIAPVQDSRPAADIQD